MDMDLTEEELERFWSKVNKTQSCWIWTASKSSAGYGRVRIRGKLYSPHRISFLMAKGFITDGKDMCHTCDNPSCVNPDHLFEGSRSDNMKDCVRKARWISNHHTGEQAAFSILTEEDVRKIRTLHNSGVRNVEICKMFPHVSASTVENVIYLQRWKHVT